MLDDPKAPTYSLFSVLHFRQCLSSKLHFRQFNGSKTPIVDKVGMRNLSVLIELAASNWFQRRQRIGSNSARQLIGSNFSKKYKAVLNYC